MIPPPLSSAILAIIFVLSDGIDAKSFSQAKVQPDVSPVLRYRGSDEGKFKILFSGEVIGEERFRIAAEESDFRASAEISLTVEREKTKVTFQIRPSLRFSPSFEPIAYQVLQEAQGNQMKASVNFKPKGSEVIYEKGNEIDSRSIELRKDVVVLDDNVFHHYIILAKRYDYLKGGVQEFMAFVPQQFLRGSISIDDKGFEKVKLENKMLSLQHLLVDTGELRISLWLNEGHELQKIAVPQSNIEVLRE